MKNHYIGALVFVILATVLVACAKNYSPIEDAESGQLYCNYDFVIEDEILQILEDSDSSSVENTNGLTLHSEQDFVVNINPNVPLMRFTLSEQQYNEEVINVTITVSWWPWRENVIQVIETSMWSMDRAVLIFEDLNFDGFSDIRLGTLWQPIGIFYTCWLWDNELGQFVRNDALSELTGISIDVERQAIVSSARRERTYYTFADDVLTPIRHEEVSMFDDSLIISEMIDGSWVVIERVPSIG